MSDVGPIAGYRDLPPKQWRRKVALERGLTDAEFETEDELLLQQRERNRELQRTHQEEEQ